MIHSRDPPSRRGAHTRQVPSNSAAFAPVDMHSVRDRRPGKLSTMIGNAAQHRCDRSFVPGRSKTSSCAAAGRTAGRHQLSPDAVSSPFRAEALGQPLACGNPEGQRKKQALLNLLPPSARVPSWPGSAGRSGVPRRGCQPCIACALAAGARADSAGHRRRVVYTPQVPWQWQVPPVPPTSPDSTGMALHRRAPRQPI